MHNNNFPNVSKWFWDDCPNPILPHWVKCRHYGFSSDDIGRFSDEKSAWKINAKCSIFAVQNLGKKKGVFWVKNGGDFGGFFLYLYIRW